MDLSQYGLRPAGTGAGPVLEGIINGVEGFFPAYQKGKEQRIKNETEMTSLYVKLREAGYDADAAYKRSLGRYGFEKPTGDFYSKNMYDVKKGELAVKKGELEVEKLEAQKAAGWATAGKESKPTLWDIDKESRTRVNAMINNNAELQTELYDNPDLLSKKIEEEKTRLAKQYNVPLPGKTEKTALPQEKVNTADKDLQTQAVELLKANNKQVTAESVAKVVAKLKGRKG